MIEVIFVVIINIQHNFLTDRSVFPPLLSFFFFLSSSFLFYFILETGPQTGLSERPQTCDSPPALACLFETGTCSSDCPETLYVRPGWPQELIVICLPLAPQGWDKRCHIPGLIQLLNCIAALSHHTEAKYQFYQLIISITLMS